LFRYTISKRTEKGKRTYKRRVLPVYDNQNHSRKRENVLTRKSESEIVVEYHYVACPDAEPRIQQAFKILFNAAHRPTKQMVPTPLQAIPLAYADTKKTAYPALFLSIQERLKAASLRPKNISWNEIYTSILQKITKQEFAR